MGSPICMGAATPLADGMTMNVSGGKGDTAKQLPVGTEWHSFSLNDASSKPEVEYRFKLVERKDSSDARSTLFGSKDVSQQLRKLELSLCGLSKYVETRDSGDDAKPLVSYPDGLKKDCSPYITMETLDSSNGVKEVRVSFHGLEDPRKVGSEKGQNHSGNHDLSYGDDGCLSLVSQLRAFLSCPKLSSGGLLSGDGKHSIFDGLSTITHSFKTSDSSPIAVAEDDYKIEVGSQLELKTTASPKSSSVSCTESPKRALFEARDLQARCDALPLAHYRPDCPVWCSRDQEQTRNGGVSIGPNSNGNSPVNISCKKPPKPPKPPRHPGRTSSVDAATIAAAKVAAARKKALKQAAAKRKARASAPAHSGGTPVIALVLTVGFGILMVFQGLFVQSSATYGDSEKSFVDVPSDQFGDLSLENANSYGLPSQLDTEVHSSSQVLDPGKVDIVISNAFYKSMQEIEFSKDSQGADRSNASG